VSEKKGKKKKKKGKEETRKNIDSEFYSRLNTVYTGTILNNLLFTN